MLARFVPISLVRCGFAAIAISAVVEAQCTVQFVTIKTPARAEINGVVSDFEFHLPLNHPGQPSGWTGDGTITRHISNREPGCNSGKVNCGGVQVDWSERDIDDSFEFSTMIDGYPVVINKSVVKDYFSNKYNGFAEIGDMNFNYNCHAYTFGESFWLSADVYSVGTYLADCYDVTTDPLDAMYALKEAGWAHSAKVLGGTCWFEYFCMQFGQNRIVERREKDGVGPIYRKESCSTPVLWTAPYAGDWTLLKNP